MTTDQAVARQAAHENLISELMQALQAIADLPAHPMRKKAVEIAQAALARAKGH